MPQRNQHYYLVISLIFFSTMLYIQNMLANNHEFAEKTLINVYSDRPEFSIKLKSNPTTGYKWFLDELDNSLVTPVKNEYESGQPTDSKKKIIGKGGFDTWTFKVNKSAFTVPKVTVISFNYMRPWESNNDSNSDSDIEENNNPEIKILINPGKAPKSKTDKSKK